MLCRYINLTSESYFSELVQEVNWEMGEQKALLEQGHKREGRQAEIWEEEQKTRKAREARE